ncbi:MAG: nucleotidyltransferase family protein [Salinibacter sp.]|uniref:nucleotidyltransferase family protein n=1 Tax=Salinibacter sp. TaxID=2065818 RepID=UPI0035D3E36A
MPIPDQALDRYRQTLRRRDAEARVRQEETYRRAWDDARRAASVLKEEFEAERVLLFGSVAREERLSPHSDLDLAVEGLPPMEYDRAVARLQSVSSQRSVDLVSLGSCPDSLRQTIQDTGIER